MKYGAVVIGTSAGGLYALSTLLEALPPDFPLPVIIVQHRSREERTLLEEVLTQKCRIKIRQAEEKEIIQKSTVYFAPPDYHLLIERDHSFSLTYDERVNYSRPSIDVLFESAAYVYKNRLLAILLTGANHDGAAGIKTIKSLGGTTIAQDPQNALYPAMPRSAITTGCVQHILNLDEIKTFLLNLSKSQF